MGQDFVWHVKTTTAMDCQPTWKGFSGASIFNRPDVSDFLGRPSTPAHVSSHSRAYPLGCTFSTNQPTWGWSHAPWGRRTEASGHSCRRGVALAAAGGDGVAQLCCLLAGSCVPASGYEMQWGLNDWNRLALPGVLGFPGGSDSKESACSARDLGSIPGSGRSPRGGHGNPLQGSCLENLCGQRSLVGYSP